MNETAVALVTLVVIVWVIYMLQKNTKVIKTKEHYSGLYPPSPTCFTDVFGNLECTMPSWWEYQPSLYF